MTPSMDLSAAGAVVGVVLVVLAVLLLRGLITAWVVRERRREQIEQARLESEARINKVTYVALQRLFEEARSGRGGPSRWERP